MRQSSKGLEKEIFDRLKKLIIDLLHSSQSKTALELPSITMETDLVEDLGLDSIEIMDLASAISNEFKIALNSEMASMRRTSELVKFIASTSNG